MTTPCNLPDYVERGGRQVWRSPYQASGAQLLGLVLPGSQAAIDKVLQRDLVAPTGGETDYRCAHDHVVMVCAQFERMASTDPPDSELGYIPEREVSFWCLTADMTAGGERLVWYLPYVFTDNGPAVAAGREVYGYPKQQADFDDDYANGFTDAGAATTVTALGIDVFGPKALMQPRPMVAVTRKAGKGGAPQFAGSTFQQFASNLFPASLTVNTGIAATSGPKPSATITAGGSAPPSLATAVEPWVKSAITTLTGAGLTRTPADLVAEMADNPYMVFLKQFRDVRCPGKACYQAIVEAGLSIDPATASFESLDPALFQVAVSELKSHPMVSDLGLASAKPQQPAAAFLADISFDILTGTEVWRAPT